MLNDQHNIFEAVTSPYLHMLRSKRTWTPITPTAGKLYTGGEDVVHRALALRCLEIPVGDFIEDATKGDLPETEGCKTVLLDNIQDEIKHDIALNHAAAAHKVSPVLDATAQQICKAWIEEDAHPVLKAVTLERSVFFCLLPMLRRLGDTGLRSVSQDISGDEVTHVGVNSLVCKELGLEPGKRLDNLRKATVDWVLNSLIGNESEDRLLSYDFWMSSSDSLFEKGIAPNFQDTRRSRMPAFFECANSDLPTYA